MNSKEEVAKTGRYVVLHYGETTFGVFDTVLGTFINMRGLSKLVAEADAKILNGF